MIRLNTQQLGYHVIITKDSLFPEEYMNGMSCEDKTSFALDMKAEIEKLIAEYHNENASCVEGKHINIVLDNGGLSIRQCGASYIRTQEMRCGEKEDSKICNTEWRVKMPRQEGKYGCAFIVSDEHAVKVNILLRVYALIVDSIDKIPYKKQVFHEWF